MPKPLSTGLRGRFLLFRGIETRSIVHLNVADFAVAVERVVDARLRGRPVIVASPGASRAAVYDMSDEAFHSGVRKGMALRRAMKLCPDVHIASPHPEHYERAMKAFFEQTLPYSPLVEAEEASGHIFVDLTGAQRLFGPPADVAWRIRRVAKKDLGLDPIWSVAPNKLLAKVATRLVKPTGEYIVEDGQAEEFLKPLPLYLLPGLEREDLTAFREFHLSYVGQAALWSPPQLEVVFGRRAAHIHQTLRGVDHSPVSPAGQHPPMVKKSHWFENDVIDAFLLRAALLHLTEKAGAELRNRSQVARRLILTLDYSDGLRVVRQKSIGQGTASDFKLLHLAEALLESVWTRRVRIRHISLTCDRLTYPPSQLELFAEDEIGPPGATELLAALDHIRSRFGTEIIHRGHCPRRDVQKEPLH